MPVEFEEFKINKTDDDKTEVALPVGRSPLSKSEDLSTEKKSKDPILNFIIKIGIAKNEDYAKLIIMFFLIIILGLATFYSLRTFKSFSPEVINPAPINFESIE